MLENVSYKYSVVTSSNTAQLLEKKKKNSIHCSITADVYNNPMEIQNKILCNNTLQTIQDHESINSSVPISSGKEEKNISGDQSKKFS